MNLFCAYCGKELPPDIIASRHYSPGRMPRFICCDREHDVKRRQRDGVYKQMSKAGNAAKKEKVVRPRCAHERVGQTERKKEIMARTITDQGKKYEVYSEAQLMQAKEACKQGKNVYIVRSCRVCGRELFGSNLSVMRIGPRCEEHD